MCTQSIQYILKRTSVQITVLNVENCIELIKKMLSFAVFDLIFKWMSNNARFIKVIMINFSKTRPSLFQAKEKKCCSFIFMTKKRFLWNFAKEDFLTWINFLNSLKHYKHIFSFMMNSLLYHTINTELLKLM